MSPEPLREPFRPCSSIYVRHEPYDNPRAIRISIPGQLAFSLLSVDASVSVSVSPSSLHSRVV